MDKLLIVDEQGDVLALHDDDLPDFGPRKIARASEVEPDENGNWTVRLTEHPVNGLFAGTVIAHGVARRETALLMERAFIQTWIMGGEIRGKETTAGL